MNADYMWQYTEGCLSHYFKNDPVFTLYKKGKAVARFKKRNLFRVIISDRPLVDNKGNWLN